MGPRSAIATVLLLTFAACAGDEGPSDASADAAVDAAGGSAASVLPGTWTVVGGGPIWDKPGYRRTLYTAARHGGVAYLVAHTHPTGFRAARVTTEGVVELTLTPCGDALAKLTLRSFQDDLWLFCSHPNSGLTASRLVGDGFVVDAKVSDASARSHVSFVHQGALHVTASGDALRVWKRTTSGWQQVGQPAATGADVVAQVQWQGKTVVALVPSNGTSVTFRTFDGATWTDAPAKRALGPKGVGFVSMAATTSGGLYVLLSVPDYVVYRLDGEVWHEHVSDVGKAFDLTADGDTLWLNQRLWGLWRLEGESRSLVKFTPNLSLYAVEKFPRQFILPGEDRLWFVYGSGVDNTDTMSAAYFEFD